MRHRPRHPASACAAALLAALIALAAAPVPAGAWQEPEPVAMVRLTAPPAPVLARVARFGLEIYRSPFTGETILFATPAELDRLRTAGISFEIVHEDAAEYFASRLDAALGPGSMGGYCTFDEVVAWMDDMAAAHPDIISPKFSLGTSHEGLTIWAFIVSDAPDPAAPDHSRPAVFYNSLIHAREPISVMLLMGFVEDIVRLHEAGEPGAAFLLASRELWFIPVINPDGYTFNESYRPGGGGMWRKNKRDNNGDGIFQPNDDGVDLNRNFGYHWGEDDVGSSPSPTSSVYRGPESFSEPETRAVRAVFERREFEFALNYHSHSNVYIHPWGYTSDPVDRLEDFQTWAARLSVFNHFPWGTGEGMIGYNTNGDAVDWEYGELGLLAMVAEVGTWYDNFWPPTSRIRPLVEDHIGPNWMTAWMAGGVLLCDDLVLDDSVGDSDGRLDPGEEVLLTLSLVNAGISRNVENATATLSVIGAGATILDAEADIGTLAPGESRLVSDTFRLRAGTVPVGHRLDLALLVQADDGYARLDTLGIFVGEPQVLVSEGWEGSTAAWDLGGFERTALGGAASGSWYLSDAPEGTVIYQYNWADQLDPISLVGYHGAVLRFRSRRGVGADNIAIMTVGTHSSPRPFPAGTRTDPDPVVYFTTGIRDGWEDVEVDLTPYTGTPQLWLSFWSTYDYASEGWGIDDIRLEAWSSSSGVAADEAREVRLGPPYPNPANPSSSTPVLMRVDLSALPAGLNTVSLRVYDTRGRQVAVIFEGSLENRVHEGSLRWDGRDRDGRQVPSGIYLIELRSGTAVSVRKVVVLR